jgi:hypothetical protein
MDRISTQLLLALEQLATEWREAKLPQEVLLKDGNVKLILGIRSLVAAPDSGLTLASLRSEAPTFVEQVQLATMRDFEELTPDGATD